MYKYSKNHMYTVNYAVEYDIVLNDVLNLK